MGISEEETSVGETSNASPLDDAKPPTQSVIGRSGITAPVGAFFAHPERANGWVGLRYRKPQDPRPAILDSVVKLVHEQNKCLRRAP